MSIKFYSVWRLRLFSISYTNNKSTKFHGIMRFRPFLINGFKVNLLDSVTRKRDILSASDS